MRSALASLIVALFAAVAMAVTPQLYDVIISVPNDAPSSVLEDAKEKVRNTEGAQITHEYSMWYPGPAVERIDCKTLHSS